MTDGTLPNPFAFLISRDAVEEAIQRAQRLGRAQSTVHRLLDRGARQHPQPGSGWQGGAGLLEDRLVRGLSTPVP